MTQVRNLSQNAGNGHSRHSKFQTFLGEHALRPHWKTRAARGAPPPPLPPLLKDLDPPLPRA